jgi:hypothetical protein
MNADLGAAQAADRCRSCALGTLDHASLIARSTGRSFSIYAKLESAHTMRSTQQRSILC